MDEPRGPAVALAVALLLAAACGAALYRWTQRQQPQAYSISGFDVSHVEEAAPMQPSATPSSRAASPKPLVGSLTPVSLGGSAVPRAQQKFVSEAERGLEKRRLVEKAWLQRYGSLFRAYTQKLDRITGRHYKNNPVVRDVDGAFGSMPRYMEIKRRHAASGDPFGFAREAIALPEVRAEIAKRMRDPKVWGAAVTMMLETLRDPPPQEIYRAAKDFLKEDPAMVEYLPTVSQGVTQNIGAAMAGIPPGTDLTPINKVLSDVAPQMHAEAAASGAQR